MSAYQENVQQARRLAILLTLYFAAGYTLADEVLRTQLASAGFVVSRDLLKTELAWLAEMGFVERLPAGCGVQLTVRGEDVALGRSISPGVRRPAPDGGVIHGT
jgi:hypothetical protein